MRFLCRHVKGMWVSRKISDDVSDLGRFEGDEGGLRVKIKFNSILGCLRERPFTT